MWPYIQARHYRQGRPRPIRLIVIHTAETAERNDTAEAVAKWFATTDRAVSAHFVVDADSVVQCVRAADTAYAAPGANSDGIQIELAGRAAQSPAQWHDDYSIATLRIAACVAAEVIVGARYFGVEIPVRRLSVPQVRDRVSRGLCGHVDVTAAFRQSNHTDPGPSFPWGEFLAMVAWWVPRITNIDFR